MGGKWEAVSGRGRGAERDTHGVCLILEQATDKTERQWVEKERGQRKWGEKEVREGEREEKRNESRKTERGRKNVEREGRKKREQALNVCRGD